MLFYLVDNETIFMFVTVSPKESEPPSRSPRMTIFLYINLKLFSEMRKINLSSLNRLRNQEFPDVFRAICSVLERDEITETYLADFLEKAKAKRGGLGLLKNMMRKHPITKPINDMTEDRHNYLMSITGKITAGLKSPLANERKAAQVLDVWLQRYSANLKKPRTTEQNTLVEQMTEDIEIDTNIAEAMESLDLDPSFASIKLITADIMKAFDDRSENREIERIMAKEVRREAYEAMKRLINALDMAIEEGNENSAKYIRYWNEISKIIDAYYVKVQMRSKWYQYAADKKKEQAVDNETEGEMGDGADGNTPAQRTTPRMFTTMQNKPYSAAGLDNGMDMDLQNAGETNVDLAATGDAMNGSGTINNNDVATPSDGNTAQADDAKTDNVATTEDNATGNGVLTDGDAKTATADGTTTGHEGATDNIID